MGKEVVEQLNYRQHDPKCRKSLGIHKTTTGLLLLELINKSSKVVLYKILIQQQEDFKKDI